MLQALSASHGTLLLAHSSLSDLLSVPGMFPAVPTPWLLCPLFLLTGRVSLQMMASLVPLVHRPIVDTHLLWSHILTYRASTLSGPYTVISTQHLILSCVFFLIYSFCDCLLPFSPHENVNSIRIKNVPILFTATPPLSKWTSGARQDSESIWSTNK